MGNDDRLRVQPKHTAAMETRDGVRLDADVYYPDGPGPFPVLLMRQPYGRAIASTVVYAHPRWYAAQGYIVVIQDVRGRGSSAGTFDLFAHEIEDGFDTVQWAAGLPNSTGQVGMYGFSYQGMTQLYAAIAQPPALKTLCPAMVAYDLYADWAYEGGAFCLQANLAWALQLASETARRRGERDAYQALYEAAHQLPLQDPVCARSHILERLAPDSHYHDWLQHPTPDVYWETRSPKTYIQQLDLPMLHIGGWFDPYLRGTLNLYKAMADRSHHPQHRIIGPWAHLPWGRKVGAIDYGPEAASPVDQLQIQWFDRFLKDIPSESTPPVSLFEMGSNQWRQLDVWPGQSKRRLDNTSPSRTSTVGAQGPAPLRAESHRTYYLSSTGLASIREDGGLLTEQAPLVLAEDIMVHDPWRPVHSLGGHAGFPAGSVERAGLDSRTDVVTYTSAPLEQDLHILGRAIAEIHATADTASFDLCVVLSEVYPNGQVYSLTQGYQRINQPQLGQTEPIRIALQPTCAAIAQGHSIRLSLSAACSPAYAVNPGTGTDPANSHLIEARVTTVAIAINPDCPSKLYLPV